MKKIKKDALAHYDRMIAWAEKQPPRKSCLGNDMSEQIGENHGPGYCSYCGKNYTDCQKCELWKPHKKLFECCNGLWQKMHDSKTWGTWVKRARRVRQYIEENG